MEFIKWKRSVVQIFGKITWELNNELIFEIQNNGQRKKLIFLLGNCHYDNDNLSLKLRFVSFSISLFITTKYKFSTLCQWWLRNSRVLQQNNIEIIKRDFSDSFSFLSCMPYTKEILWAVIPFLFFLF